MRIVFIKNCVYNLIKRRVGTFTKTSDIKAQKAIDAGVAIPYNGTYPPKRKDKLKINLKDLK